MPANVYGDIMIRHIFYLLLLGSASAFAVTATAQTAAAQEATTDAAAEEDAVATIRVDGGVIMLSEQDRPFMTVVDGQPAAVGDRLMVAEESGATVRYNDGCDQKYDEPGIYEIEPDCIRAAALVAGPRSWTTGQAVLAGLGGAALAAYIVDRRCRCDCPPVSR